MRELDELELLVVVDNETDTLSSIDNAEQSPESQGILDRIEPTSMWCSVDITLLERRWRNVSPERCRRYGP